MFMQGAAGNVIVLQPTKTAMTFMTDIDSGTLESTYLLFQFCQSMGRGSTQEPPRRFNLDFSIYCTVVAIWNYFRSNMYGSAASEPSSEQGRRKHTSH